jgi:hypothetical protein
MLKSFTIFRRNDAHLTEKRTFEKNPKIVHFQGLSVLNMQKYFWFVWNFEHVNFVTNGKYSKQNYDHPNYYASLVIFQTYKNVAFRSVHSLGWLLLLCFYPIIIYKYEMDFVATPLWGKCEDETHIPKSGNLESSGTPKTSEFDCRGQNTSPWGVLYTVGKVLKFRCRKWSCMSHSDICSTSYGQKTNSWPLKVENRPDPGVCM